MKTTGLIQIAIVDDCSLIRFSLRTLISYLPGMKVQFEASNGKELFDKLQTIAQIPDVIILDIGMPMVNGYEAIDEIKKKWSDVKVIILSQYCGEYSVKLMLQKGANAFLSKNGAFHRIKDAIYAVVEHEYYYSEIAPKKLFDTCKKFNNKIHELSPKQKEVLHLIFEGNSNKEIAEKLDISFATVESYRKEICKKLEINKRTELVHFVMQNEIFNTTDTKSLSP